MYSNDSFFTLSTVGQAGLIALSFTLTAFIFWLASTVLHLWRWDKPFVRYSASIPVALALFWIFVWVSPQIYYSYYLLLFDELRSQIVIDTLPRPRHLFELMTFTGHDTLSAHLQGVLGWLLIGYTISTTYRRG